MAALLLLPPDVWPMAPPTLRALVAAGGVVIGDVDADAAVCPHPDETWPIVRTLLGS